MKKKITVVDKTFTPIVVLADANSAIYEDRGQRLGEQNLLSETVITCTAMDGTKKVATMKASILQVPTKFMPAATTSAPGIPAKQLAINYLCDKSAEVDERYDREKNDNIAMILPVTTHLYIDSLEVEEPYRNRGIATAMLDFIITVTFPDEYPTGTDLDGNELELAGKEAVFRTTLKEVDEVTLTDENVKDNIATQDAFVLNNGSAVDTVDRLNQFYNEKYEQDALSTAVFNYVVENSSISEIPQQLLDDQRESYRQEIQAAIASYDMTEDEYFQQVGVDSMDALLDTYADQIKESVSDFLIFQAVAEEQKIKVTDDDVNDYFGGDALSVKQAKAYYGEAYLNQNVLYEKVYTWLVDHASIV